MHSGLAGRFRALLDLHEGALAGLDHPFSCGLCDLLGWVGDLVVADLDRAELSV